MEPEMQPSQFEHGSTPEMQPNVPSVESLPSPDRGVERSAEQFERRSEMQAASGDAAATALPQVAPVPQVGATQPTTDSTALPTDDNPIIAADEDLIEKEWVDKAKKIIAETKDDPYRREAEVSKLQADYIEKRYGRRIGQPSE